MCRQGCCTTCAVKVNDGKVKMDAPLGLLKELREDGYALTCCSYPKSDITCSLLNEDEVEVYSPLNIMFLVIISFLMIFFLSQIYIKQWAEGFEGGGVQWGGFLPDDDWLISITVTSINLLLQA